MLHSINIALFYVTLLMLDYFNIVLFDVALFDAALFSIAPSNVEALNSVTTMLILHY